MDDLGLRRRFGRTLLSITAIMLLLLLGPARPAASNPTSDTPDVTCDAAHEGWLWFDGIVEWECRCAFDGHGHLICEWVPLAVVVLSRNQVYYGSYGHTRLVTAFDSNPDYGAAMTHSRNTNGTTRIQGSGELRSRVIFQKWNGSSWVNCVDSGYSYSSGAMSEWMRSYNMYTNADCGAGTYRVLSYGYMYDSGWRGGYVYTAACYRD